MQIVTLTTDFGLSDHYAGMIKGALLSKNPSLNITDITHNVKNFDIVHAAFMLRNTYPEFPEGTIHLVSVKNFHEKRSDFIVCRMNGHFFVGPDNGLLSLVFQKEPDAVYRLECPEGVLGMKSVFANAVAHIAEGKPLEEIGEEKESIEQRISLQPVVALGTIRGAVVHVDNYGNVILNITKEMFSRVADDRSFEIFFKRNHPIREISRSYSDVPVGELLCLFNSAGHMEIAINMDSASEKYGLRREDTVIIQFGR